MGAGTGAGSVAPDYQQLWDHGGGGGGHRPGPGQRADAPENLALGSDGDPVSWCSDCWGGVGPGSPPTQLGLPKCSPALSPRASSRSSALLMKEIPDPLLAGWACPHPPASCRAHGHQRPTRAAPGCSGGTLQVFVNSEWVPPHLCPIAPQPPTQQLSPGVGEAFNEHRGHKTAPDKHTKLRSEGKHTRKHNSRLA